MDSVRLRFPCSIVVAESGDVSVRSVAVDSGDVLIRMPSCLTAAQLETLRKVVFDREAPAVKE